MSPSIDPAWYGTIFWYAVDLFPKFEGLGFDGAKAAAMAASDRLAWDAGMFMRDDKTRKFSTVELPNLGHVSGPYAVAVASAFLVWSQHLWSADPYIPDSAMLTPANDGWRFWRQTSGIEAERVTRRLAEITDEIAALQAEPTPDNLARVDALLAEGRQIRAQRQAADMAAMSTAMAGMA